MIISRGLTVLATALSDVIHEAMDVSIGQARMIIKGDMADMEGRLREDMGAVEGKMDAMEGHLTDNY